MGYRYAIHPSIGVARVGNSKGSFYLAPDRIGGLPYECDEWGNMSLVNGQPEMVSRFKDGTGQIRRQGARFRVFRYDDANPAAPPVELTLADDSVRAMNWTVHVANKKAAWYEFLPLLGDIMLDPENTYAKLDVPLRNNDHVGEKERRKLIIDPGPRSLAAPRAGVEFDAASAPPNYEWLSFPGKVKQGHPITTLGAMRTDDQGRLVVVGGYGYAGGDSDIAGFGGADTWHDDIADGPVTCKLELKNGDVINLDAWVVMGSPKFAPELVNIVTLDDIAFDVAVRFKNLVPELCYRNPAASDPFTPGTWNPGYAVNFKRDIEPIFRRPLDYIWVSNVPSMVAFAAPQFDPKDNSEANRENREDYFKYFRHPTSQQNQLFSGPGNSGIPLMPVNSGSNSVRTNPYIDKFLTLTETQYFMLGQWATGNFTADEPAPIAGLNDLDRVDIGNCVGSPMCPGIEVTWSTRNPNLYDAPYHIQHRYDEAAYFKNGLSPSNDETFGGGCEPGDLTKRMAIPWQADFFNCTAQFVNFTEADKNKDSNLIPIPPTYYSYWWPPQSPMWVVPDAKTAADQALIGVPSGYQVNYLRGINSYAQMINGWYYIAFITNQNPGSRYPYFVETERKNDAFEVSSVAVGGVGNFVSPEDTNFMPVWFMKPAAVARPGLLAGEHHGAPVRSGRRDDRR